MWQIMPVILSDWIRVKTIIIIIIIIIVCVCVCLY